MQSKLDYRAIATFCAFGFFLDDDTYYTDEKFKFDTSTESGRNLDAFSKFNWHYHPREIDLDTAASEFAPLFEQIIDEQTDDLKVILPLSGGLDSRTQAAALKRLGKKVHAFSYRFAGGIDETDFARRIAAVCGFPLESWEIQEGYLWERINQLASINGCYTDFTHPRQMAFLGSYSNLGEVFSLGHWGDVLFDSPDVPADLSEADQVATILKKFTRKGGHSLAEELWSAWDLPGKWMNYIQERIRQLLVGIPIESHAGARIRAFKSKYWATRWTAANFTIFTHERPITVPYFDTRMCELICTIPESLLSGRKIQIEYLKKFMPELARIPWQAHRPFNLFNYHLDRVPLNIPYRVIQKALRSFRNTSGKKHTMRNWELQFKGENNNEQLRNNLSGIGALESFVPADIVRKYFNAFNGVDQVANAHPLSMLLTLSVFAAREQ